MRILYTADPEIPVPPRLYGGIERIVASLVAEMRKRGHTVGLAAHRDSILEVDQFYPWPGLRSGSILDSLRNAGTLLGSTRAFCPDVVHSFSRIAYLTGLFPLSVPKLMSYQRDPSPRTTRWGGRLAAQRMQFSGCSEWIAAKGRQAGGVWHAIANFVEPAKFTYRPSIAGDAPLVYLSRIEEIKGCHTAIAIAKASGRRLLIAGNRVELGSSRGYWDREIAPHLKGSQIEYVGPVDDIQKDELLGKAAALVVPIEWEEPFGIVFVEALACGTPVISCPRGALPEIIESGKHGFLINSVAEGSAAVNRLAEISRKDCRARMELNFSVQCVATQYEQLYRQLIKSVAELN